MANITNFTFQGAYNASSVQAGSIGHASFSFKPPTSSTAWAYRLIVTDGTGYTVTTVQDIWSGVDFVKQGFIVSAGGLFVAGTTYTASITFSTVAPPGAPSYVSTPVTTTFSIASTTAQLCIPVGGSDYKENTLLLIGSTWPLNAVGSVTVTGPAGYTQTVTLNGSDNQFNTLTFTGVVPGNLYTAVATVPGLTSLTRTFYPPTPGNTFGSPTIGLTSATLPWTDPVGASVAGANCYTTCMLYNSSADNWNSVKIVAPGTQTVSFTGLDVATQYDLYCWPTCAGGFADNFVPGSHSISFTTGGVPAVGSWGIGSFYSPPYN